MTPLPVGTGLDDVEGVNVVDVNPRHGLWSFGLDGGGGVVEFWDPRSRSALTRLILPSSTLLPVQSYDPSSIIAQPIPKLSVTSLASHPTDGLSLAIGTSSGHTLLYDLRSPSAFAIKDQGYGEKIKTVEWLRGGGAQEDSGRVVSADSKVIKVWQKDDVSYLTFLLAVLVELSCPSLRPITFRCTRHHRSFICTLCRIPVYFSWHAKPVPFPRITYQR